jgi:hypothetical protein
VIGSQAGIALQRMPSSIYWAGLGSWGISHFPGSQSAFHAWLRTSPHDADTAWDPDIPAPPNDFPRTASLALTPEEARYLRDLVAMRHSGSLLAWLLLNAAASETSFAWSHPQLDDLPTTLQTELDVARRFSLSMHGAALLYNAMLARAKPDEERLGFYLAELDRWATRVVGEDGSMDDLLRRRLWSIAWSSTHRVSRRTSDFVDGWLDMARAPRGRQLLDDARACRWISSREFQLKQGSARLRNAAALQNWRGASGAAQLGFRWETAETIVNDIRAALGA